MKRNDRRSTELVEIDERAEVRRAFGVSQLMNCMDSPPQDGKSYHIVTGGKVDLLSHVLWLKRYYSKINHIFISCWAISAPDILMLERMAKCGDIGEFEILVGDIFASKYKMEWKKLNEIVNESYCTGLYTSKIHSKVMLIDIDGDTKIVIESSANCNANPRVEQSCVTKSAKLYDFYDSYFHDIFREEARKHAVTDLFSLDDEQIIESAWEHSQ